MSDPFRPDTKAQLYREAQFGLAILACLIALFVYLAIERITDRSFELPDSVRRAPVAKMIQPDGSPRGYTEPDADPWVSNAHPIGQRHLSDSMVTPANAEFPVDAGTSNERPNSFEPTRDQNTLSDSPTSVVRSQPIVRFQSPDDHVSQNQFDVAANQEETLESDRTQRFTEAADDLKKALAELTERRDDFQQKLELANSASNSASNSAEFDVATGAAPSETVDSSSPAFDRSAGNEFLPLPVLKIKNEPRGANEFPSAASVATDATSQSDRLPNAQPSIVPSHPIPDQHVSLLTSPPSEINISQAPPIESASPIEPFEFDSAKRKAPSPERFETTEVLANEIQNDERDGAQRVVAENGDSYYSLAQDHYGDGRYFRALFQHNQQVNQADGELTAGAEIVVPELEKLRFDYSQLCPRQESGAVLRNGRTSRLSASQRIYTTKGGETLFGIARDHCGQASRYVEILRINREWLESDDHLERLPKGLRLVLPQQTIQ
ncbi:MAG: hypothetical protein AAFN77_18645 [Planctomycetota bacterium]